MKWFLYSLPPHTKEEPKIFRKMWVVCENEAQDRVQDPDLAVSEIIALKTSPWIKTPNFPGLFVIGKVHFIIQVEPGSTTEKHQSAPKPGPPHDPQEDDWWSPTLQDSLIPIFIYVLYWQIYCLQIHGLATLQFEYNWRGGLPTSNSPYFPLDSQSIAYWFRPVGGGSNNFFFHYFCGFLTASCPWRKSLTMYLLSYRPIYHWYGAYRSSQFIRTPIFYEGLCCKHHQSSDPVSNPSPDQEQSCLVIISPSGCYQDAEIHGNLPADSAVSTSALAIAPDEKWRAW